MAAVVLFSCANALGQESRTAACAGCHGAKGEGTANGPRIAGQPAFYLERQLEGYADGRRTHEAMTPIAKGLGEDERRALARHYAALSPPPATRSASAGASRAAPPRGKTLALLGDDDRRVQACANCHGPDGAGQAPSGPYLRGLPPEYLRSEMHAWRVGTRKTDPSGSMNAIARNLTEEDIAAVTDYYASLDAPKTRAPAEKSSAKKKATPTKPGAGTKPAEGTGVEGGAATTGGAVGPGGGGGASGSGPSGSKDGK